jgi:hypothetical protein
LGNRLGDEEGMVEPIVQSAAEFTARRPMVHYLERELEMEAAEEGLPLRDATPNSGGCGGLARPCRAARFASAHRPQLSPPARVSLTLVAGDEALDALNRTFEALRLLPADRVTPATFS